MRFDSRQAKLLKAGNHMTLDGAPGLRLVASSSARAWIYRYKSPVDGRMRQVKLGTWPAMSFGAAASEWERMRQARDAGRDPAQERRANRRQAAATAVAAGAARTVAELVAEYVEHAARGRAEKGGKELRRTMRTMLVDPVAGMAPEAVTRSAAYDLISAYSATPVQARNLRRELAAAWDWAHDSGRLDDDVPNWWRQVLRGKLASGGKIVGGRHQGVQKRALTLEEVGAVLRHLPHLSRLPAELLTLYLWTGCRGAEIVAIEGREISEEADGWWWTIPRAKLKMSRHPLAVDLRVPLIGRALEIVRARMDVHGTDHLYPPQRGEAPHVDQKVAGVAVWWHMPRCRLRPEQARPRWPVADWAPHDLRRTVRTHLAALGCPSDVAEAVLGHIQPGVEGVYNRHSYDTERRHWLTLIAQRWEAAAVR